MKFANLYWQNTELAKSDTIAVNIGDNLQFMVIDYLYSLFLPEDNRKEIKYITMKEMKDYRGEILILPMNWSLFDQNYMCENRIAISEDIIPVFLGMTIQSATYKEEYFNEFNISYLKRYEPIGCRDEYTMKVLQRHHIRAYLNGCLTAVLPKRESRKGQDKIFFVDVPTEVTDYIPEEIRGNYLVMTQQYYYPDDTAIYHIIEDVKKQYFRYANEAKLVVSSRLHVISPCMAMGIPVIFTKNQIDARYGWIDKYIPFYDRKNYDQIDWHPRPIEYEQKKRMIIENAVEKVKEVSRKYATAYEVSEFYEKRESRSFVDFQQTIYENFHKATDFLQSNYKSTDSFTYSIWGVNKAAEKFYDYISREYPNAKLKDVIDSYKEFEFYGKKAIKPIEYKKEEDEIIFVLPVKASNAAEKYFAEKGIDKKSYVCCGDQFIQS